MISLFYCWDRCNPKSLNTILIVPFLLILTCGILFRFMSPLIPTIFKSLKFHDNCHLSSWVLLFYFPFFFPFSSNPSNLLRLSHIVSLVLSLWNRKHIESNCNYSLNHFLHKKCWICAYRCEYENIHKFFSFTFVFHD